MSGRTCIACAALGPAGPCGVHAPEPAPAPAKPPSGGVLSLRLIVDPTMADVRHDPRRIHPVLLAFLEELSQADPDLLFHDFTITSEVDRHGRMLRADVYLPAEGGAATEEP